MSGISWKDPPSESWESLTSQISGVFWRVLRTSYFLRLPLSILSVGPQGFSPFPLPNTRSGFPFPLTPPYPVHFPSQVPPSFPTCDCFLLPPKWDWGVLSWTHQLVDIFEFCGLYFGYSILFFSNIHLLVSTYHACPFGSELLHSGRYFLVPSICLQNSWCPCCGSSCNVY